MKLTSYFYSTLFVLAVSLLTFSCKKDKSPAVSDTWWQVDAKTFNSNNNAGVLIQNDTATIFGASTKDNDAILIVFKNKPTDGIYHLIDTRVKTSANLYADNECAMLITSKNEKKSYWSLFEDGGMVSVQVKGKKTTATFTNVKLGLIDESLNITESFASGNIVEK